MALDKTLLKKINLLYVEDDETIRTELASLLSNFCGEVQVASDGQEGLSIYEKNKKKINLIVSDITMPKMNGIEMVKKIREFDQDIDVIFATAYSDKEFLIDSIKLKVYNYVVKPIDIRALLDSISELAHKLHSREIIENKNIELAQYKEAIDDTLLVLKTDTKMKITHVNPMFEKVTSYEEKELIGKEFKFLKHDDISKNVYDDIYAQMLDKKSWNGKLKQVSKEGSILIVDTFLIPSFDEDGNINGSIIIQRDITQETLKQRQIQISLMKEKSEIFIKSKEGLAKNSIKINQLESEIQELEKSIKNSEVEKDKYLYLINKYKIDLSKFKARVEKFEKEENTKLSGMNVLRIKKENADLRIEVKRLKDRLESLLEETEKKVNQNKMTTSIQIEELEKEITECKEQLKSMGNRKALTQKIEYWKEKAKVESQRIEELEQKIVQLADKSLLTKIFGNR